MPGPSYSAADDGEGHGGDAKARREAGGDTAWSRWSKLIAACLVVLCVILLIVIIVLSNKDNNLKTENELETCNNNLNREREQLQTSNNNLNVVREQLKTSNNNLNVVREQLKTSNNNLNVVREQFQKEREELERFLKLGWTYSNSSVYIIINEQKSWTESRKNCRERGADLVIINSREEQEFVTKLRGSGKRAWIGLSGRENKWKWVDDTTLITGFWGSGQPNSNAGDEDCVITGETSDPVKNWGDDPCSKQYNWICEKTIFN